MAKVILEPTQRWGLAARSHVTGESELSVLRSLPKITKRPRIQSSPAGEDQGGGKSGVSAEGVGAPCPFPRPRSVYLFGY